MGGAVEAGDGSGTDNPALLRGNYGLDAAAAPAAVPSRPLSLAPMPGNCAALIEAGIYSAECVRPVAPLAARPAPRPTSPPIAPAAPAVIAAPLPAPPPAPLPQASVATAVAVEPTTSLFGAETPGDDALTGDWQVVFKGSSTWDQRGQRYEIVATPQGNLSVHRARGEMRLAAGLELSYVPGGDPALTGGNASAEIDQQLWRDLTLHAAFALDGSTEKVNAVTSDADIASGPTTVTGTANFALERQAGRAGFILGASLGRQYVGDTRLVGGGTAANASQSWSGFGLSARASYALTPIIGTYVELKADRAFFDAAAGSGAYQNNWSYRGTLGLTGQWRSGLKAELYGGYGVTSYDSSLLTSAGGFVLGGSLTYPVARGGEITASLETDFAPTDTVPGTSTSVDYAGNLALRYIVNDWLTLRSALGGTWTTYPGLTDSELGLSVGAGLDWIVGPHTALSADYTFGADFTPTGSGVSHTIAVGATVKR